MAFYSCRSPWLFIHGNSIGFTYNDPSKTYYQGLVGSMPLQFLEIGFHVEIHAIEWHDFEHETQFHGVVVA